MPAPCGRSYPGPHTSGRFLQGLKPGYGSLTSGLITYMRRLRCEGTVRALASQTRLCRFSCDPLRSVARRATRVTMRRDIDVRTDTVRP
jgi:hypothetical protein